MQSIESIKSAYKKRITGHQADLHVLEKKGHSISNLRLAVFILLIAVVISAWLIDWFSYWWIAAPIIMFLFLLIRHEKNLRAQDRVKSILDFYEYALDRVNHTWQGKGAGGTEHKEKGHLYAEDLDLFGEGSLFELLCIAKTSSGESTLARWLQEPARPGAIRQRQQAIEELRFNFELREDLAVLGSGVRSRVHPQILEKWGERDGIFSKNGATVVKIISWCLTIGAILSIAALAFGLGPFPLVLVIIVELLAMRVLSKRIEMIVTATRQPMRELKTVARLLERLQNQSFRSEYLRRLSKSLGEDRESPSVCLDKLNGLIDKFDQQSNQLFAPFAFLLMWAAHFGLAIESWRGKYGPKIGPWLEKAGKFEALTSLACFAYEHPGSIYPEIVEDQVALAGENLSHPLIKAGECVPNSIKLDDKCKVWVVSGSNMSGKTTFLRVVGINSVLAFAGAPVLADKMKLCLFAIGATIRIHDSLQEGASRFYAEITRLRDIYNNTEKKLPVLFLVDEILHGTNSHDRKIGAEGVIKGLIKRGAVGLVTTHDLALAETADALDQACNVHFDDTIKDGELVFDYTLKEGVVKKSNALELMRSVGLKV